MINSPLHQEKKKSNVFLVEENDKIGGADGGWWHSELFLKEAGVMTLVYNMDPGGFGVGGSCGDSIRLASDEQW